MATNVSERDKALREVMDSIDKQLAYVEHFGANAQGQYATLLILKGQIKARLGYSGSMPSEVPNQSEDTQ